MTMRKLLYTIVLIAAGTFVLHAQDAERKPLGGKAGKTPELQPGEAPAPAPSDGALQDTVFTIPDYNAELPTGADILAQDITVKPVKKFHSTHMIGVRYGVNLATAKFTPDPNPGSIWCFNNYGIVYTYYNDLWDMLDNFGTQVVAHLNHEGYTAELLPDMEFTVAQLDLLTILRFDINPVRLFANVGPYAGYRIANSRENSSWEAVDNRFDYGLIFGGGAGVMMGPFEFQLEANYKWGLSSYYHTYYYSDEYWLFSYPRVFMFSGTLYYKF